MNKPSNIHDNLLRKSSEIVSVTELETWTTWQLLSRLKHLRQCYETRSAADDYYAKELNQLTDRLLFKSDPRWKQAFKDVKALLANREHIERKSDRETQKPQKQERKRRR